MGLVGASEIGNSSASIPLICQGLMSAEQIPSIDCVSDAQFAERKRDFRCLEVAETAFAASSQPSVALDSSDGPRDYRAYFSRTRVHRELLAERARGALSRGEARASTP